MVASLGCWIIPGCLLLATNIVGPCKCRSGGTMDRVEACFDPRFRYGSPSFSIESGLSVSRATLWTATKPNIGKDIAGRGAVDCNGRRSWNKTAT
jgi:hypothetical protein